MTERPPSSGIYAVYDGWTRADRFAAYSADSGGWGMPQTDLRLFNATPANQPADSQHRHTAWRELTADEMLALSPTAQAWAAGFLPAGAAILLVGQQAQSPPPRSRRGFWSSSGRLTAAEAGTD
jgi:hypothetical protein